MASTTGSRPLRNSIGLVFALAILSVSFATPANAQVLYEYTGNGFTVFTPSEGSSYTNDDHVRATLTFLAPLPANLDQVDVTGFPGFGLTLADGHQELVFSSAIINDASEATVSTDGAGLVTAWKMFILCCDDAGEGEAWKSILTSGGIDLLDSDYAYLSQPSPVDDNAPMDGGATYLAPGTWSAPQTVAAEETTIRLIDDVDELVALGLNHGQATAMTRLLINARRSMERGRDEAACSQIRSFVDRVIANTPPLTPEKSTGLIEIGLELQVVLGCAVP